MRPMAAPCLEILPDRSGRERRPRLAAEEWVGEQLLRPPGGAVGGPAGSRSRLPRVLSGLRVLVVDDDLDTLEMFSVALTACGAEVLTASRARDALRYIAGHGLNVVVSDIAMPDGDGYWLVEQIRRQADVRTRAVPVVAVTAFGREHSRARALASGFTEHLQKPVDPETLCRMVARAAGR